MRIILAGSRSFGCAVFKALVDDGHEVVQVVAPGGDRLERAALNTGHGHWPYVDLNLVRKLDADLIVAAHSHNFISKQARAATRLGGIGYHPSLLPRHRGRDAVRWTVHMNDPVAGGSVYWLTDNVDGGPIAAQEHVLVKPGEDASMLWHGALFPLGVKLIRQVLQDLENKVIVEIPQDAHCATWEPSWERPPLHRPDLPQIGGINGYKHVTRVEQ